MERDASGLIAGLIPSTISDIFNETTSPYFGDTGLFNAFINSTFNSTQEIINNCTVGVPHSCKYGLHNDMQVILLKFFFIYFKSKFYKAN